MTTLLPDEEDKTQALLVQVLALLERQEQRQLKLERSLEQLQDTVAMVIEMGDAYAAQAIERGVDPVERGLALLKLMERLSAPERLAKLERLIDDLETLPNHLAIATNALDGWAQTLAERGVDLHAARQNAANLLVALFKALQSERVGGFEMISPAALEILNRAGSALEQGGQEASSRAGALKLWRAMRDPHVQRALSFGISFGRRFGQLLQPQLPQEN